MPGLIVFRRRWSAGSDDLVVPSSILFTVHLICFAVFVSSVSLIDYTLDTESVRLLWYFQLVYIGILSSSLCVELGICIVSMRGSILDTGPRANMHYWLYMKLVTMLLEVIALSLGIVWIVRYFTDCPVDAGKKILFAMVICNWSLILFVLVTIWCTFDAAGRSWVKMKKYQRSMRESESRFNYKRSGSMNRNWRQRKVIRAYQDSWDHRCRLLFCCMGSTERNRSSFADIAKLLSDFFRELDVVPSDVVAGLVLLRKFQKIERQAIVRQRKHGTYEFLSGVPVTERTRFLRLNDSREYDHFQTVIHYMNYALAAYGWPMFLMTHSNTGLCQLLSQCCCLTCSCCRSAKEPRPEIVDDNCCSCNYAAMRRMIGVGDVEVIYTTFHVDVGETPFFVAVDYARAKIVVSIRGTLSMQDVLTDLNAEGDVLPLEPPRDDWLGHKGMVQAAVYIRQKLREESLIERALSHNAARGTERFELVLVGHSLGAGTAAILAILMKAEYPSVECYSFSPPGGLLSMPAVEYSKGFVTSVVVGKDVVPRIGLHQMETLRADLINAIKRSVDPKWKTIACTLICCCCGPEPTSVVDMETHDAKVVVYEQQRTSARKTSAHPNDSSIALTLHNPLYPPGRIIHVVRHHPTAEEHKYEQGWRHMLKSREPVYQAIWVDNTDFDEVLISPAMIQDHMPDMVLAALNKVITTFGPRKPQRQSSNANSSIASDIIDPLAGEPLSRAHSPMPHYNPSTAAAASPTSSLTTPSQSRKVCLETSFTSLQSPATETAAAPPSGRSVTPRLQLSRNSNGVGGGSRDSVYAQHSSAQLSSILQYDVSSLSDTGPLSDTPTVVPALISAAPPSHHPTVIVAAPPHNRHNASALQPQRSVAFESTNTPMPRSSAHHPLTRKPIAALAAHGRRSATDMSRQRIDLVYDDWYGMAPLASPETLSEISSISSRTSLVNTVTSSIEKYLQRVSFYPTRNGGATSGGAGGGLAGLVADSDSDPDELTAVPEDTQLRTPRIMRRTPKIAGNLAGCADDWRSVDTYKRMGKVFVSGGPALLGGGAYGGNSSSSSSNGGLERGVATAGIDSSEQSFESANSLRYTGTAGTLDRTEPAATTGNSSTTNQSSKSVDNLDGDGGGGGEILSAAKLTWSDGDILGDSCQSRCPHCPCRYYRSGSDCCPQLEHGFCTRPMWANGTRGGQQAASGNRRYQVAVHSGSSDATFYSAESFGQQMVSGGRKASFTSSVGSSSTTTSSPPRRVILEAGVLESHFPCREVDEEEDDCGADVADAEERSSLLTPRSASGTASTTGSDATMRMPHHASSASVRRVEGHLQQQAQPHAARRKDFAVSSSSSRWTDDDEDGETGTTTTASGAGSSGRCFSRNESLPLLAKTLAASLNSRGLSSKRNRNVIYPVLSSYSRNASPVHQQRQTISSSSSSVASTKGGESSV